MAGIEANIYFYSNETLFDNGIKLLKMELDGDKEFILIEEYLNSLKQLLWNFSLNGKRFSNFEMKKPENLVESRNNVYYNYGLGKINRIKANYDKSFEILNYGYERQLYKIRIDYNWNFHFFELLFHCFYLNFADCLNMLNDIPVKSYAVN